MSHAFRHLPKPTPLRRAALIEYEWGPQHFEIVCIACSLRLIEWPDTGEEVVWLHCSAMPTAELNPNGPTRMLNVLIPAHYITSLKEGPTFRLQPGESIPGPVGIFPPIHPTPANRLSLEEVEFGIANLLSVELN